VTSDREARRAVGAMIHGYKLAQAVYVAAKLGLADAIAEEPTRAENAADRVGADPAAVRRLLRMLAAAGVFAEVDAGTFVGTPASACLRTGVPGSRRDEAILNMEVQWPAWGELLHAVRTGRPGAERAFGVDAWTHLARTPAAGAAFDAAMAAFSRGQAAAVAAAVDWRGARVVVDVGGGDGTLLAGILRANPGLSGVLLDTPGAVSRAETVLADAGVADRCRVVAGDFFEGVPAGGDAYVLKWVLHDWDDERAGRILRRCREAMDAGATLRVVEALLPPGLATGEMFWELQSDVHMLTFLGGRERTEEEIVALLTASGFSATATVPTGTALSVVEATAR